MENVKLEWVDIYRPNTLDEYVLNAELKKYFKNMIKTKSLQNLTFIGQAGSGKTTLARILAHEFDAEVLFVKCATEGTLDVLRTKIQNFCNAMSMDGKIKICILDEVDSASASGDNNFQKGLRTLIEAAQDDTRFILTANFQKIIPAVLSRCPIIPLKFDKKDLLVHIKKILDNEKVKYDKESLKAFIEEAFHFYPDCRRIIKYLQFCSNSGKLVVKLNTVVDSEKTSTMKEIVDSIFKEKNILNVRQMYLRNKDKLGDLVEAGSHLFNYVVDNNIMVDKDGILKLTDLLFQLNTVVDKEPTFFGMLVAISKYGKESI